MHKRYVEILGMDLRKEGDIDAKIEQCGNREND